MCGYNIRLTTTNKKIVAYFYNSHHGRRLVTSEELQDIYSSDSTICRRYDNNVASWFKSEHPDQDVIDYKEFYEYGIQIEIERTDKKANEVDGCPKLVDELHKYFMDTFAAGEKEHFSSSGGMNYSHYHYDTDSVNLTTLNSSIVTVKVRVPCSQKTVVLNKVYEILLRYGDIVC